MTGAAGGSPGTAGNDDHKTVPSCQHTSPSPWGLAQCALPDGHDRRHAYSPSEAIEDARADTLNAAGAATLSADTGNGAP